MLGDRLFYNDIMDAIKMHNLVTEANVYCYKFNYRGKYSLTNVYAKNFENYGNCLLEIYLFRKNHQEF